MVAIAIDAMGGDEGPAVVLQCLPALLSKHSDLSFWVYCTPEALSLAPRNLKNHRRIQWKLLNEVVSQDDWPATVLRNKRHSTMGESLQALADDQVQACVSAGNTGALVALSKYLVGLQWGLDRPALGAWLPAPHGNNLMLDVGANLNCDSDMLVQFALMGSAVVEQVLNKAAPKVALLNVGSEMQKGGERLQAAYTALMSAELGLNFIGYVEGHDIFSGKADVIVCDGFAGNTVVKACEGLVGYLINGLGFRGDSSNLKSWFKGWVLRWMFKRYFDGFEPSRLSGAVLLGLKKTVVKCHGRSNAEDWSHAILYARTEALSGSKASVARRLEALGPNVP